MRLNKTLFVGTVRSNGTLFVGTVSLNKMLFVCTARADETLIAATALTECCWSIYDATVSHAFSISFILPEDCCLLLPPPPLTNSSPQLLALKHNATTLGLCWPALVCTLPPCLSISLIQSQDLDQRHNIIDKGLHRYVTKPLKLKFDNAVLPKPRSRRSEGSFGSPFSRNLDHLERSNVVEVIFPKLLDCKIGPLSHPRTTLEECFNPITPNEAVQEFPLSSDDGRSQAVGFF
ncbi:hypothetical protein AVEN_201872-1 [Araneus ventricosus]|uniref:Uncharacterized protein n=1 Tax=Araneus ventricosus TaxID=182803 RepID=A0A4Y2IXM5_ARAVE|nr:hypothetical protein AVEN_201872-1 [Araneus ventricosus]